MLLWKPSVMPLLQVKRHMVAIYSFQLSSVWPSWTASMELLYVPFIREKQYLLNVSPRTVDRYRWA